MIPVTQRKSSLFLVQNPCAGCPLETQVKVMPSLPSGRKLTVVGLGSWNEEERAGYPFAGVGGQMLRSSLTIAGLDHETEVGYLNLTRCKPPDGFDSPEWGKAADRCWHHLQRDLQGWTGPILLLGSGPLQRFLGDKRASVKRRRGLWVRLPDGREAFSAEHPAGLLRETDLEAQGARRAQFQRDLTRMADRLLGRERFSTVQWQALQLTREAFLAGDDTADLALRKLGAWKGPWFFDIETFDAKETPSRRGVATDPFHPDFRVRGVAMAVSGERGVWFEFDQEMDRGTARGLLDQAFGSDAEKGAFVSGFDATGLIAQGWVTEVRNLTRDPWLAAIALDTRGGGHSLERLVVDVLGEPQPLGKDDRGRIAELSMEEVAEYAVNDACGEFRLDQALQGRLDRGEYL
jgi:uracil-DNA glycosylase family 4